MIASIPLQRFMAAAMCWSALREQHYPDAWDLARDSLDAPDTLPAGSVFAVLPTLRRDRNDTAPMFADRGRA